MSALFYGIKNHTNTHIGIISLVTFLVLIVGASFSVNLAQQKSISNSHAAVNSCTPLPPQCQEGTEVCPTPPPGTIVCPPKLPPTKRFCGTIVLQNGSVQNTQAVKDAESCFWNAYLACTKDTRLAGASLTVYDKKPNNQIDSYVYRTKSTRISTFSKCSIAVSNNSSCNGLGYTADSGLKFSCEKLGNIVVPAPSLTITPTLTPDGCYTKTVCPANPTGYSGAPLGCYPVKVCPTTTPITPPGCYYECKSPSCTPGQPCRLQACQKTLVCPSISPVPTSYITPTCTPRPPCLDSKPACEMPVLDTYCPPAH